MGEEMPLAIRAESESVPGEEMRRSMELSIPLPPGLHGHLHQDAAGAELRRIRPE